MRPIPLLSACLCVLFLCLAGASAQETRIAALVNDDVVSVSDLAARITLAIKSAGMQDNEDARKRISSQVLRGLIDERLQMQEAKRLNVSVSKEEIDQALARLEQQNKLPKGGLDDFLAKLGISKASLVDQITASLTWSKLVRGRLMQDVTISDEEINEAMARLKAEADVPQNRVAEIFLAIDNPSQEPEVKQLADRLVDQIRGGVKFSAVARQFSQSPTAAVGGDLGYVTASQLPQDLADTIKKMNPGEMSYPVHTGGGYYILYLMDRKTLGAANPNDTVLSLVQVVLPIPSDAPADAQQRQLQHAQQISDSAKSCGELAKIGRDEAPQTSREIAEIKAGELAPAEREVVLGLAVAQASKPLPMPGGIGVVMVCQRKNPTGGLPTREELADSLARERLDALARRYMRDLRRSAYVDIRG
jgi:peptidyl-prolyl cis-trans isomerase SurA